MVTYEKIKSRFSRNWSLRNRGKHFASSSVYFFVSVVDYNKLADRILGKVKETTGSKEVS
ncbi:hypothetical protein [Helicobacter pylori]|uniref:hypothetical protein n=1 Tax=Helicobacter pylori TaxID=210 RepID=UPI000C314182|nr:hypothetical protein [Helicobacter pylori]WRE52397.1 hypothetical protein KVC84_02470 [Helicobacter pylori]